MSTNQIVFDKLIEDLKNFNSVKLVTINYNRLTIIFIDDFKLYVERKSNCYYPYYTYLDNNNSRYFYVDEMPHSTIEDVYIEIYRMSNPVTRTNVCKSNYFKSY